MTDKKTYKPFPDGGSLRASAIKKSPKAPDYWGNIAINLSDLTNIKSEDGLTIVKINGWKKVDSSGKTYLSLAVDRFVPNTQQAPAPRPAPQEDMPDDDIPF
jgi:hypothetical protein